MGTFVYEFSMSREAINYFVYVPFKFQVVFEMYVPRRQHPSLEKLISGELDKVRKM